MSVKAFTSDKQRVISTTPTVNVSGQVILAKVYEGTKYLGIANAVKPDPATARITITYTMSGLNPAAQVIIEAKYRYESAWTAISTTFHVLTEGVGNTLNLTYDMEAYDDVRVRLGSGWGATQYATGIDIEKAQFTSLDGMVVGGVANEQIDIPCDFREFEAGERSIVFEAADYGVIGRDVLVLFGADGYSLGEDDATVS